MPTTPPDAGRFAGRSIGPSRPATGRPGASRSIVSWSHRRRASSSSGRTASKSASSCGRWARALKRQHDLRSQVAQAVGGREEGLLERNADRLVARRDPGRPRRAGSSRGPSATDSRRRDGPTADGSRGAGPRRVISGRSVPLAFDQTQTVGARWSRIAPRSSRQEADVDVVVVPRATREGVDRPAADDPPR